MNKRACVFGAVIAVLGIAVAGTMYAYAEHDSTKVTKDANGFEFVLSNSKTADFQVFSTTQELRSFLKSYQPIYRFDYLIMDILNLHMEDAREDSNWVTSSSIVADSVAIHPGTPAQEIFEGYSTTNIQVRGVDEPDFIKNDGEYAYVLVGNELVIVRAYPAETARITFESDFDVPGGHEYQEMFLNNDRLAVIYEDYEHKSIPIDERRSWSARQPVTNVLIFDITNRNSALIVDWYSIDGAYHDARMIGNQAYIITKSPTDRHAAIPEIRDMGGPTHDAPRSSYVYYFEDSERISTLTTISAIDVTGKTGVDFTHTYLMGDADTVYVSENSIYLTLERSEPSSETFFEKLRESGVIMVLERHFPNYAKSIAGVINSDAPPGEKRYLVTAMIVSKYESLVSKQSGMRQEMGRALVEFNANLHLDSSRTTIHKIPIDGQSFSHMTSGEVAGHVLNQFSMDEHDGQFRIATTVQQNFRATHNNVYILDERLELVGSLEGIAEDESIYSARFANDKLYMVTFRQVDPFFVIDLSDDTPRIMGYLKIPGFSNYLHPYDKNTVIGIGRDEGVKIAMFDISNFYNPQLKDSIIIGNWFTDSAGLYDHKAILIDSAKKILSLPVLNEFYVYGIDRDGFEDLGTIRHGNDEISRARSFYIGDVLYTVTDHLLKANDLNRIDREIKTIHLN